MKARIFWFCHVLKWAGEVFLSQFVLSEVVDVVFVIHMSYLDAWAQHLTVADEILKTHVVWKNLENLTYIPKDNHGIALYLCQELQRIFNTFYHKLLKESGLLIRPPTKDQVKKIWMKYKRQKLRQSSIHHYLSAANARMLRQRNTSTSQEVTQHTKNVTAICLTPNSVYTYTYPQERGMKM